MKKLVFILVFLIFYTNCATTRHEPVPLYPERRERIEPPVPMEEITTEESIQENKDHPVIELMRNDMQKASDYLEGILFPSRKKESENSNP